MRNIQRLGAVVVATTLAATLGAVAANPAQAAPDSHGVTTSARLQAQAEAYVDAAIKLEPHLVRANDGTLSMKTTAAEAGVDRRAYNQVAASLRHLNRAVRGGELVTSGDLQVQPAGPVIMHNGVIYRWWGMEVHFDAVTTNRIIGALNAGAGVATLISILTIALGGSGVLPGIAAALLVIGGGVLQACANSDGVKVMKPYAGPVWCTGH